MFQQLIISIFLFHVTNSINSNYLELETSYKPRLERNGILNKGVWIKKIKDNDKSTSNFMFRGNAVDVDNILQNNFNAFEDNNSPNSAFVSSYVERTKRALEHHKRHRRFRKSVNDCSKGDCNPNSMTEEKTSLIKSKLLTKLKPSSLFNDYPYEIALLLGNNKGILDTEKDYSKYIINEMIKNENEENKTTSDLNISEIESNYTTGDILSLAPHDDPKDKVNYTVNLPLNSLHIPISTVPKRSMTTELDEEGNIKVINLGNFNSSNALSDDVIHSEIVAGEIGHFPGKIAIDRDIFAKEDKAWSQNAPLPNFGRIHKHKDDDVKVIRPVTERGLVKVLSMLTRTFKKIMKQHSDIKEIHRKLSHVNEDFLKNIDLISQKFKEFDTKYNNMVKLAERLRTMDSKLTAKELHYKAKERELSKNLVDFEIQQKKFLQQQKQFYNIQKLMLAQNERINVKQFSIAKTQSEISHRQNNFARILKKAKQIYIDTKFGNNNFKTSHKEHIQNQYNNNSLTDQEVVTHTTTISHITTTAPETTDSIKINLFSIPSVAKIKNQDQLLLDEKDEQPVDDLVYKYYFNNTFIDNLMKHFLSNFLNSPDNGESYQGAKDKREDSKGENTKREDSKTDGSKTEDIKTELKEITNTVLLPVNKTEIIEQFVGKSLNRQRRWISHHSRKKWHKKNRAKDGAEPSNLEDEKLPTLKRNVLLGLESPNKLTPEVLVKDLTPKDINNTKEDIQMSPLHKNNAFLTMAKNFCNGIGQNQNGQILDWCVEKALRKLQNIDVKPLAPSPDQVPLLARSPNSLPPRLFEAITKPIEGNPQGIPQPAPITTAATGILSVVTLPSDSTPSDITPQSTNNTSTTPINFPDNDKLESNLKEFDLTPDVEGNVYYDGSLHASDMIRDHTSDGDDIMPGLESNSKIDTIDPDTFDTKAMRRAVIRRMRYDNMFNRWKM